MAANRFLKVLFSIELNGAATNRHRQHGVKLNPAGWNRETVTGITDYSNLTNDAAVTGTNPSSKMSIGDTGENFDTPANTMLERDYHIEYSKAITGASGATYIQRQRNAGR